MRGRVRVPLRCVACGQCAYETARLDAARTNGGTVWGEGRPGWLLPPARYRHQAGTQGTVKLLRLSPASIANSETQTGEMRQKCGGGRGVAKTWREDDGWRHAWRRVRCEGEDEGMQREQWDDSG